MVGGSRVGTQWLGDSGEGIQGGVMEGKGDGMELPGRSKVMG